MTLLLLSWLLLLQCLPMPLVSAVTTTTTQQQPQDTQSTTTTPHIDRNLIINGTEAPRQRFPYMASLSSNGRHVCGGTLIAPDIILTAAHCAGYFDEIQLNRHDLIRDSIYESYVIQDTVMHPRYYFHANGNNVDVDEYDFLLVKLYGDSGQLPVRLNREPTVPTVRGEQLRVIGWGVTDNGSNIPTDKLRQVTVDYIPNEDCAKIEGYTPNGNPVDLANRVIDITLCAADFTQGEDTCQGDSGGPILLADSTNSRNDVQVGVTSFGINGCADPNFPGFYARISHAHRWIDQTVCSMTNYPSASLGCNEQNYDLSDYTPDFSPSPTNELIDVTFEIRLDVIPSKIGWIIQSPHSNGANITYASRPISSYRNQPALQSVRESIKLPNNRQYYLVLLDRTGNGLCCNSYVHVYPNNANTDWLPQTLVAGSFHSRVYPFVAGRLPTAAPTLSPPPTRTVFPSSAPTVTRPFVTVSIDFDRYASETGWQLERIQVKDSVDTSATIKNTNDPDWLLLAVRYPGDYAGIADGESRVETVNLPLPIPGKIQTYRFTMTDNEGDGLCCKHGQGQAVVYWGDGQDELMRFDQFYLEEAETFTDERLLVLLDNDKGNEADEPNGNDMSAGVVSQTSLSVTPGGKRRHLWIICVTTGVAVVLLSSWTVL